MKPSCVCSTWSLRGVTFMSRLCQARVLTVLGQEACQLQSEDGALLTNYLDPEYRDLLYALVDDKPGARGRSLTSTPAGPTRPNLGGPAWRPPSVATLSRARPSSTARDRAPTGALTTWRWAPPGLRAERLDEIARLGHRAHGSTVRGGGGHPARASVGIPWPAVDKALMVWLMTTPDVARAARRARLPGRARQPAALAR